MNVRLYVCWMPRQDIMSGETPWPAGQGRTTCADCGAVVQFQYDIDEVYVRMQREVGPIPRVCIPCAHRRVKAGGGAGDKLLFLGPNAAVEQLMSLLQVRR